MSTPNHLILVDGATPEQLNAVQELVADKADGWWHYFATAWIVGGNLDAKGWREIVKPALRDGEASVLVLHLPDQSPSNWAYYGTEAAKRTKWLKQYV